MIPPSDSCLENMHPITYSLRTGLSAGFGHLLSVPFIGTLNGTVANEQPVGSPIFGTNAEPKAPIHLTLNRRFPGRVILKF